MDKINRKKMRQLKRIFYAASMWSLTAIPCLGQAKPEKLWEVQTVVYVASPAVGNDGMVYCATISVMTPINKLYALHSDGTLKWAHDLAGVPEFDAVGSFDGGSVAITGAGMLQSSSRLSVTAGSMGGPIELRLVGEANETYGIEVSEDLLQWQPLRSITNATGTIRFGDPTHFRPWRFYRAVKSQR